MKATRAIDRDGYDGRQSHSACRGAALLGWRHFDALAGGPVFRGRCFRRLPDRRCLHRALTRALLVTNARSVDFRFDVRERRDQSFVFGVAVSLIAVFEGYDAIPTAEECRVRSNEPVYSALAILALDFVLTSFSVPGGLMSRKLPISGWVFLSFSVLSRCCFLRCEWGISLRPISPRRTS